MRRRVHATTALIVGIALVVVSTPVAAPVSIIDDFPGALSNYRTGGWQWPYNDGTGAGTVTAGRDNRTAYMDATYNAMAYAIRQTPEVYDFTVTVDFVIPTRDYTPGDQFVLYLRWRNPTYPDQLACPACVFSTADSGIIVDFFLGEQRLILIDIANGVSFNRSDRSFGLTIGIPHEARVELAGPVARVSVDGTESSRATNLTNAQRGLIGIVAYREDVILDRVQIEVAQAAGVPSEPPFYTGLSFMLLVLVGIPAAIGTGMVIFILRRG